MKNNFHFYLTWNDNNFLPFQRVLVKSDKSKVIRSRIIYIYIYFVSHFQIPTLGRVHKLLLLFIEDTRAKLEKNSICESLA